MEYKALELKVGFTVFIAILVFSTGMMWLEGFKLRGERYEVHAVFPMVGGVRSGDAVNVNGVEKGEVTGVNLRELDVIVTMAIGIETKIPEDSKVVLQTQGIMGERIVTIIVGRSEVIMEPGSIIEGVYDPGVSEALASMGQVMEDLHWLAADIRDRRDAEEPRRSERSDQHYDQGSFARTEDGSRRIQFIRCQGRLADGTQRSEARQHHREPRRGGEETARPRCERRRADRRAGV